MKKGFLLTTALVFITAAAFATDPAIPLTITSGFNADVIAEGADSAVNSTSSSLDASENVFYDATYDTTHGNNGGAVPAGALFSDGSGNQFSLAPATGNNALLLSASQTSGSLAFSYPANNALTGLLLVGASADGDTLLDYTLNFEGGVTLNGSFTLTDWYDPSAAGAFTSFGRVGLNDSYNSEDGRIFSLYTVNLTIPEENYALRLQSINLSFSGANTGAPHAAIFGVSAFDPVIVAVPEPSTLSLAGGGALALLTLARRKFSPRA